MTEDAAAGAARPSRPVVLGASADGGTAYAVGADFSEPRPRRRIPVSPRIPGIPRRTLVASVAALLLLAGPAVGTNAILTAPPPAFAVFDAEATDADESALAALESWGFSLVGDARVLAPKQDGFTLFGVRAQAGATAALRATAGFPVPVTPTPAGSPGDPGSSAPAPDTAPTEVCLWLVQTTQYVRAQCTTDEQFARHGVAVSMPDQTVESFAYWGPDGSTSLEHVAYGPTTLEALRALEIPAIEIIDRPAAEGEPVAVEGGTFLFSGEQVLAPRRIAVEKGWQMSASVYRPTPVSGLAVCTAVFRVDAPTQQSAGGCIDVPTFASGATSGGVDLGTANVTYSWQPSGEARLEVEER